MDLPCVCVAQVWSGLSSVGVNIGQVNVAYFTNCIKILIQLSVWKL